jgi:cell division protein FtsW (lipid II flippase)
MSTHNYWYLGAGIFGLLISSIVSYRMFDHIKVRVTAFLDPWTYIDDKGYQITQSLFAIGTGGWFGMGLTLGSPDRIPVVERDFIFSAISEEFGCIFSLCLILICISTFLMFMHIAMTINDAYYRLAVVGFAVNYAFQIFLTVGGATKFIPLTGVTLPLVSYGGSSVLATLIMFSIVQGVYISNKDN